METILEDLLNDLDSALCGRNPYRGLDLYETTLIEDYLDEAKEKLKTLRKNMKELEEN